jgi:ADP-ribose pyrophosphatase YjhB (NUDIX family)
VEREVLEETGYRIDVTGYLGVWVDRYADDPTEPDAAVINVAYYTAVPADGGGGPVDPVEVSEVAWFAWDVLPAELAPPGTLEAVLGATRSGSPFADRPR